MITPGPRRACFYSICQIVTQLIRCRFTSELIILFHSYLSLTCFLYVFIDYYLIPLFISKLLINKCDLFSLVVNIVMVDHTQLNLIRICDKFGICSVINTSLRSFILLSWITSGRRTCFETKLLIWVP